MNNEKFEIVIIDDNPKEHIHDNLKIEYPNAQICTFTTAKSGADYILNDLNKKRIVFLDYKFSANEMQGLDALKAIRSKTSLLYIILMTAELINIKREELMDLISDDGISLISSDVDSEVYIGLVEKNLSFMNSRLDSVLEQWIIDHPSDRSKTFLTEGTMSYSLNDILSEIRNQTQFGKKIERKLFKLIVHMLINDK
jgi:CheY-like chemotaxis protein